LGASMRFGLLLSRISFVAALSVPLLALGCPGALHVREVAAHPNVYLPHHPEGLAIALESTIPDAYDVPPKNGVRETFIRQWRETLLDGFHEAFKPSFTLADDNADLIVQ